MLVSTGPPQPSGRPTIVVECVSPSVAVVGLRGDHDLESTDELWRALARACGRPVVIVDLSECTFIDSTALNLLLAAHRRQTKRGEQFEVVVPSKAHAVDRMMPANIDGIVTTHETRSAALANIQSEQ